MRRERPTPAGIFEAGLSGRTSNRAMLLPSKLVVVSVRGKVILRMQGLD
jgi:hypothetical protein